MTCEQLRYDTHSRLKPMSVTRMSTARLLLLNTRLATRPRPAHPHSIAALLYATHQQAQHSDGRRPPACPASSPAPQLSKCLLHRSHACHKSRGAALDCPPCTSCTLLLYHHRSACPPVAAPFRLKPFYSSSLRAPAMRLPISTRLRIGSCASSNSAPSHTSTPPTRPSSESALAARGGDLLVLHIRRSYRHMQGTVSELSPLFQPGGLYGCISPPHLFSPRPRMLNINESYVSNRLESRCLAASFDGYAVCTVGYCSVTFLRSLRALMTAISFASRMHYI